MPIRHHSTSILRIQGILGTAGPLEALLWEPIADQTPLLAAVVCHPHPLYGGTMHNKVVYRTAQTLLGCGLPALRFNFRGVGASPGAYDESRGETQDARAALDFLAARYPGIPLLAAGFSFGALVGMRAGCAHPRVVELIGLGLPVNDPALDFSYLRECRKPKLLLIGERDPYASSEKVKSLAPTFPHDGASQTHIVYIPDADHFFTDHLDAMTLALTAWLRERHPELRQTAP